eukprot:CAMPEP_0176234604 /NCGR_PEP_ID=MMETSP0121_2-20121125/26415_1 /TAXON_ID=160619 /ORGANISM="Kryptoperidinium foliaceum, Strain CCMP 1326" /LENGTH=37 /DNA_ID= /DNA_START= /DNA_END= /DNA_ORIENTATION=
MVYDGCNHHDRVCGELLDGNDPEQQCDAGAHVWAGSP